MTMHGESKPVHWIHSYSPDATGTFEDTGSMSTFCGHHADTANGLVHKVQVS